MVEDTWRSFVDFTNNADEAQFLNFVQRFEWSYAAPGADELSDAVRHQLRLDCGAVDDIQIEELHQRLSLFVFRLLTQPGIKRLTKQVLREQFAAPTRSESDHALLERLKDRFGHLEHRVDEIEATIGDLSGEVKSLASRRSRCRHRG